MMCGGPSSRTCLFIPGPPIREAGKAGGKSRAPPPGSLGIVMCSGLLTEVVSKLSFYPRASDP